MVLATSALTVSSPRPVGRPRGSRLAEKRKKSSGYLLDALYVALCRQVDNCYTGGRTRAHQALADKLVQLALEGSERAISEIFDRVEGRPVQPLAGSGAGGEFVISWLGANQAACEPIYETIEGEAEEV